MGYVPPKPPPPPNRPRTIFSQAELAMAETPRLNLDRHGMPKDYATYVWLLYGKRVDESSPDRLAFLHGSHPRPALRPSVDRR